MKNFIYFLFLLILVSSCKKYKFSKPCKLDFESSFVSANNDNQDTKMNLSIDRITFIGDRKESSSVEIEKKFDSQSFILSQQAKIGINMDIPIGTYETYSLKVRLSSASSFSFTIPKKQGIQKPIIISFDDDLDLEFKSLTSSIKLEKKKEYVLRLTIDSELIFNNISQQALQAASSIPINGINSIVINSLMNTDILDSIKDNLKEALTLEIVE